ncbi:MmcQ/YjbR family DNA-binding protein [Apilactobacillus sp. M161]|uniref:MmcQ/YjbR family DNA-binding protein n=1 Tax=Apilactobacillus xinyiensis TaxID=2841032 RepID=A0ABT0I234_9LACO|nr:MmcQ/YjbR family DNA-binding protein [Apilactobacillus xinyiensis]MCK8624783.1 MmcQ/YjbR family DNA-binding protein [Apilactobacillus xinyiensis]
MIERTQINAYIEKTFHVQAEKRFTKFPDYDVFRRLDNHKWFGIVMDINESKMRLAGSKQINLINLKLEPELIGILLGKDAYFPAYHMNKEHWISININADEMTMGELKPLIDASYQLAE